MPNCLATGKRSGPNRTMAGMPFTRRTIGLAAVALASLGASAPTPREFPDELFFYKAGNPFMVPLDALVGKPAPALSLGDWIGPPVTPQDMRGNSS